MQDLTAVPCRISSKLVMQCWVRKTLLVPWSEESHLCCQIYTKALENCSFFCQSPAEVGIILSPISPSLKMSLNVYLYCSLCPQAQSCRHVLFPPPALSNCLQNWPRNGHSISKIQGSYLSIDEGREKVMNLVLALLHGLILVLQQKLQSCLSVWAFGWSWLPSLAPCVSLNLGSLSLLALVSQLAPSFPALMEQCPPMLLLDTTKANTHSTWSKDNSLIQRSKEH